MRTPRLLAAATAAALTLTLSACGDDADSAAPSAGGDETAAAEAFPITVEHVYGETTIEEKPERVATVAWANHEVPLALGIVPVGMSKATWGDDDGDGVLPWVEDNLEELDAETPVLFDETEGIDFEAVADTQPDLILAAYSGITQEEYDTLSKIAPVIAYPDVAWGTSVQDMILMESRALGLAAEGQQLVADLDQQTAEAYEAHPALAGKSIMFSYIDPNDLSQVGFYTTHDTRPGFLAEVGMTMPGVVEEASAETDEFYVTRSAENPEDFADVDVFVTYGDPDGEMVEMIQSDPLLSKIPAVERGSIAVLEDSTPLAASANPSPLSIGWGIDEYFALLEAAAEKGVTTTLLPGSSPTVVRRRSATTRLTWVLVAVAVLALVGVASVAFGARIVGLHDIVGGLSGAEETIGEAAVVKRIPRTFLAMLVGAALGVAGAVLQGITRNPIADPGILGVTTGASLAVVTGIAFFGLSSPASYIWVAIAGAAAAASFVYAIGSLGRGGATPLKLALAGAASSAAFTSLISAILLPRVDVMDTFRFWQIGGVGGASYSRIAQVLPFLVVGAVLCLASARGLNSLALGDDLAAGLGEKVAATRLFAFVGAITLCGAATAVAGPIAFVGLVVPHLCRLLIGIDHRWLLPLSAIVGATLLTAADVVGRVVARPEEIDVGIITAFLGAPFFIYIVRRQKVRAL